MGGSTKKVEETVKRSDLGRAGAAVQDKGSEAIEYTKQKGREIGAGADTHLQGMSKGMQSLGDTVVGGLQHNLGEISKILTGGGGGGSDDSGAQSAVGQYSSQKGRAKARKGKGGDLAGQEKKRVSGKQKLFVRK